MKNGTHLKAKTPTHRDFAGQRKRITTNILPESEPVYNNIDDYDNQIEYLEVMGKIIDLQLQELKLLRALDELETGL